MKNLIIKETAKTIDKIKRYIKHTKTKSLEQSSRGAKGYIRPSISQKFSITPIGDMQIPISLGID